MSWRNHVDEYRKRAEQCIAIASSISDRGQKFEALDMAAAWLRLAEQAEKNSATDAVYVTPGIATPELPGPPRPR